MTSLQNAVPYDQLGTATAANVMFRQVGGSLAVAIFGAIFVTRLSAGMGDSAGGVPPTDLGPGLLASLAPEARSQLAVAVTEATHPIYWIAAALAVIGLLLALRQQDMPLRDRARMVSE